MKPQIIDANNGRKKNYGKPTIAINKYGTFLINKAAAEVLKFDRGNTVVIVNNPQEKKKKTNDVLIQKHPNGFMLTSDENNMLRFTSMVAAMAIIGKRPAKTYRYSVEQSGKLTVIK